MSQKTRLPDGGRPTAMPADDILTMEPLVDPQMVTIWLMLSARKNYPSTSFIVSDGFRWVPMVDLRLSVRIVSSKICFLRFKGVWMKNMHVLFLFCALALMQELTIIHGPVSSDGFAACEGGGEVGKEKLFNESHSHLFLNCHYSKSILTEILHWTSLRSHQLRLDGILKWIREASTTDLEDSLTFGSFGLSDSDDDSEEFDEFELCEKSDDKSS
ncbi:hypothetical protein G4B88_008156 [Cannabis sativa]|uniref:Uncharacterized protein n=1 Tax=Cannabis sativa TaxID=3483 RepID=A0A7J6I9Z7_CANSA|nr:hypothetical protein G4B88_008156 [Cannabis sativa]